MQSAPDAFEKWWQALPLRKGEITSDHIRQAWDAGVIFEREACAQEAEIVAQEARTVYGAAKDEDQTTRMIVDEISALARVIRSRL